MSQATDQVQQRVQQALRDFEQLSTSDEQPSEVLKQMVGSLARTTTALGATAFMPTPGGEPGQRSFTSVARIGPLSNAAAGADGKPLPAVASVLNQTFQQSKPAIAAPDQIEFKGTELLHTTQFYIPIDAMGKVLGVLHLIEPAELDPKLYRQYVAFAQQGARAAGMYLARRQSQVLQEDAASSAALLRSTHQLLAITDPADLIHELANQGRALLHAQRIAVVGYWGAGDATGSVGFSDAIEINRKAVLVRAVEMIADTVRSRQVPMSFAKGQKLEDDEAALDPLLEQIFSLGGAGALCVTPIRAGHDVVGVMLAEYADADQASAKSSIQQDLCHHSGPILQAAIDWRRRPLRRTSALLAAVRDKPISYTAKILGAIALTAAIIYALFIMPVAMVVRGEAKLEPAHTATSAAPFAGRIVSVKVTTGQSVKKGDLLLQLDDADLQLDLARTLTGIRGEEVEAEAAFIKGDRPANTAAQLRGEQLQIKAKALRAQIDRAQIRSQIDGVVLTERPQQFEGMNVSEGDVIMRIADLSRFDLIVDLSESDVSLVEESVRGGRPVPVTFLSRPWPDIEQRTEVRDLLSLSPSSQPDEAKKNHIFHVTAPLTLNGLSPQLALANPTGRARLDVGQASIAQRYGRHLWRFIQMTLLF